MRLLLDISHPVFFPDMTVTVDWALNVKNQPIFKVAVRFLISESYLQMQHLAARSCLQINNSSS